MKIKINTVSFPSPGPIGIMNVCFALIGLLLFSALAVRAADRFVVEPGTPGGTNTGEFTDWSIAATQIQWAVDKAVDANDTVWVSNGVYVLTSQINVTRGITLRSAEGHGPDDTIINGGYVAGSATTNNRCLVISNSGALVHGFTLSNGAVQASIDTTRGGGVLMYSGILSNCYVRNNFVFVPTNSSSCGGGGIGTYGTAYGYSGGTITACRVTGNVASNFGIGTQGTGVGAKNTFGGGIYGVCFIFNCIISSNTLYQGDSGSWGGGVCLDAGSTIQSSLISHNRNMNWIGGGIWLNGNSTICCTMLNCTSTFNYAKSSGGGIAARGAVISNCVVSYNQSDLYGGGLYSRASLAMGPSLKVYNTTFTGNTNDGVVFYMSDNAIPVSMDNCVIEDSAGAGIYMFTSGTNIYIRNSKVLRNRGGGILCDFGTASFIRNCLIANNTNSSAGIAGGLYLASTSSVSCCTIASNQAKSGTSGSGVRFALATTNAISVSSCIIYSNGVNGADDVYASPLSANTNALQYSCVGVNNGFTGAGIIVTNPLFKDFAGGDYRLASGSPCINKGSIENWMTNAFDLDGRTRVRYEAVDMGAYEYINVGTIISVY